MRSYELLMKGCGAVAALLIAAMTLLVGYDVVMRNVGASGLPWILDVTEYMLPTAICASAPWLMYRNAHIRLDLLTAVLSPAALKRMDRLAAGVGMLASALFAWFALALLLDSRTAGSLVMKSLVFPEWWVYVPVPISFTLLAIECARRLFMPWTIEDAAQAPIEGGSL